MELLSRSRLFKVALNFAVFVGEFVSQIRVEIRQVPTVSLDFIEWCLTTHRHHDDSFMQFHIASWKTAKKLIRSSKITVMVQIH